MISPGNETSKNKRLTIGYVTLDLSSSGGWGRYSRSLAESVAEHANVIALTSDMYKNETKLERVHVVLPHPSYRLSVQIRAAWQIYKYMRRCDVIHSLIESYGPATAFAGHILGIPTTMTLHGTYAIPPKRFSLKRLLMWYMYRRMKITTTGSLQTERKARERVKMGECRFIPNGVNLEQFRQLPGISKKDFILTVGMLKRRKGVDTVIEALGLLKDEFPDLGYIIVAEDAKDGFSVHVHSLVTQLGLEGRVTFLEGISDTKLIELYNEARAFVLSARSDEDSFEGFPMVYYEANGCGTPVITTGGFGSEYAIKDGRNGYIVPQENPSAIAEAVRKLMTDPHRYEEMVRASVEAARAHTWEKIASEYLMKLYQDCITISQ